MNEKPCKRREYCENFIGSYTCYECNPACVECSGKGADNCEGDCYKGYKKSSTSSHCIDIDECEENPNVCTEGLRCVNKPGSFECQG